MLLDDLHEELGDRLVQVLALRLGFELVGHVLERIGHRHVEDRVRPRDVLRRADGAELELVAREGKRARAVAVAGIARERRQHAHADIEHAALFGALGAALLDLLEDVGEHVAEEDGDDRRRRFVRAEAMIVARARDAGAQQPLPLVHRAQHRRAEHEELHVVVRVLARTQQVVPLVVAHRPVEVLARSVDAGERLLVQQACEAVLRRRPPHRLHRHHLVIGGDVGVLEDRRDLVLARRDLVVARLHRHADLVQLGLDVGHERHHAIGDGAEVLILELLPLRRARAEERAAGVDQIGTRQIEVAIDQEIFLLRPARRDHALGRRAEQLQHAHRLLRQRFHRAQERRFLVERLARPAHERRRDHERHRAAAIEQPWRARGIPRGVAARLEGGAHAARGKARGVGLALDQFLAGELGDGFPVGGQLQKGIVLLGGDAGERLEPVRVVRGAVLDRPFLHRLRDGVGGGEIERLAVRHRAAQRVIHRLGETGLLHLVVEDEAAERGIDARVALLFAVRHRPVADRADRVAEHCRTHVAPPCVSDRRLRPKRIISRDWERMNYRRNSAGYAIDAARRRAIRFVCVHVLSESCTARTNL